MSHIAILVHKDRAFEKSRYFLSSIAELWAKGGLQVSVLHEPGPFVKADLMILHVDLTVVPPDYLAFAHQYPRMINGHVKNISKRLISANLVDRNNGYDGPVIVKTNSNSGGVCEELLAQKGSLIKRYAHTLRNKLPWGFRSYIGVSDYRIFESPKQVPRIVWYNPNLVVERFLPERRNGYYCLRTWIFLGDKEMGLLSFSNQPVVKSSNVVHREIVSEVPDELRQIRKKLGFDFGKFDYAMINDRVVLYDANWTPAMGALKKKEFLPKICELAEGIKVFLKNKGSK